MNSNHQSFGEQLALLDRGFWLRFLVSETWKLRMAGKVVVSDRFVFGGRRHTSALSLRRSERKSLARNELCIFEHHQLGFAASIDDQSFGAIAASPLKTDAAVRGRG